MEWSVSVPQQQHLSSCSRNMWNYRWLKQGSTSTTLVTKASWIIVQRRYCAGPRLKHARDVSLGTKVVTEKEQLAQHKENNRFSPFFLLLLLSFFLLFHRALNILIGTMTTLTIRLLHTAPSNSDLTTLVIIADAEISRKIVECSDRILLQGQIRWKEDNFKFSDYI